MKFSTLSKADSFVYVLQVLPEQFRFEEGIGGFLIAGNDPSVLTRDFINVVDRRWIGSIRVLSGDCGASMRNNLFFWILYQMIGDGEPDVFTA